MSLQSIRAISPIDGRYAAAVKPLQAYFSEFGLIRYRVLVEIEYFIALTTCLPELEDFPARELDKLRSIHRHFTEADAIAIKEIEATTNHDVKA
ncbi:MAG: adenylosuccinate lyase, partial [Cyclobacteriaceae bacterium]|nr:adenylosuccinate lyase [Cyclobacteriaceae bacterium]